MPSTQTQQPQVLHSDSVSTGSATELDIYAAEFAKLVERRPPSRKDAPSTWLSRLPDEAFLYYHKGTATFGREARTPIERRGRLYLIHTALVFMWMSWGKSTSRERFQSHPDKGTRRAASLITLEHYKRGGVFAAYDAQHWFFQPVADWEVSLRSAAVDIAAVPQADLRSTLRSQKIVECSVNNVASLRASGALPSRSNLVLN